MAKLKEMTMGAAYTYCPSPYHPIRGEASVTFVLEDGDDPDELQTKVNEGLVTSILHTIAGFNEVHEELTIAGRSAKDLLLDESDMLPEDDDDDFDL